jgi:hypothetical protein
LGRQYFTLDKRESTKLLKEFLGNEYTKKQNDDFFDEVQKSVATRTQGKVYSEPLFRLLGAETVDSMDYSDYEEATVIHDLTVAVPNELKNKYTCVIDGGLLEHVYDYPVALKNAMDMVAIGGHLIMMTPGNNWFGHGFYQFSPELFYSVLREENGFTDTRVYCNNGKRWYLISNPRLIRRRTELSPQWPNMLLYVVSKKANEVPDSVSAYQSDYEDAWAGSTHTDFDNKNSTLLRKLKSVCKLLMPYALLKCLYSYARKILYFKTIFKRVDL